MIPPLLYFWEGDCFRPVPRHAKECDRRFTVGERYFLDEIQERSVASHRQFFAAIREGWMSLPDGIAERFPTPEALRKYALIRRGFRDERSIAAASRAEALRIAAFIRPMDEFAVVTVAGTVVTVFTAKSQSYRQMGKVEFQRSKQEVLEFIDDLLSVPKGETEKAGEATA